MKKLELKGRKLLRYLFGCVSFTAVAFVFQACYGTMYPDRFIDVKLMGTVRSKTTNAPIKGIKVTVGEGKYAYGMGFTDENGNFDFFASVFDGSYPYEDPYPPFPKPTDTNTVHYARDSVKVHFLDIDSTENGWFEDKTVIVNPVSQDKIKINVILDEKK